jgi:hypothetical protein
MMGEQDFATPFCCWDPVLYEACTIKWTSPGGAFYKSRGKCKEICPNNLAILLAQAGDIDDLHKVCANGGFHDWALVLLKRLYSKFVGEAAPSGSDPFFRSPWPHSCHPSTFGPDGVASCVRETARLQLL